MISFETHVPAYDGDAPDGVSTETHEIHFRSIKPSGGFTADPIWLMGKTYYYRRKIGIGHNGGPAFDCRPNGCGPCTCRDGLCGKREDVDPKRQVTLPEGQDERNTMCLFDGFMAYFPNAMAEVAKLSHAATQQHHPDEPMHWDRSKSLDHLNKIGRHMIDAGKFDDKGQRHSAALAWRAMANLQEELERDLGLPPSPASQNRPW